MNGIWGTIPDWVSVLIALLSFIGFVLVERNQLLPLIKKPLSPSTSEKIPPTEIRKEKTHNQLPSYEADQERGNTDDNPVKRARFYSAALIGIVISLAAHPFFDYLIKSYSPKIDDIVLLLASDVAVCVCIGFLFGVVKEYRNSLNRLFVGVVERILIAGGFGFALNIILVLIVSLVETTNPDTPTSAYSLSVVIVGLASSPVVHSLIMGTISSILSNDSDTIFDERAWKFEKLFKW